MLSYKIILDNNSTCFSSEVDYVSRYIERCYLVKRTNSDKADVIISYGKSMKCDSNIHLTPELMEFALSVNNNGISLVDKKPVIHALKKCMAKNNEKYTTSSTGVVCFKEDLIALSFILLSRIEERSSLELDQHERYSINNDIVFCAGLYGLPIVDMLIDEFIDCMNRIPLFYDHNFNFFFVCSRA